MGFFPDDLSFYRLAMHHKSDPLKDADGRLTDNERLEFLGDAVLEALSSDYLYVNYPLQDEGFLTDARSKMVKRETMNMLAIELGLEKMIHMGSSACSPRQTVYGNALEALFGAIYLDRGYEACRQFLENRILNVILDVDKQIHEESNYKSRLLEWSQVKKLKCEFRTSYCENEQKKTADFICCIYIDEVFVASAHGLSKKSSQQAASEKAMNRLETDAVFSKKFEKCSENGCEKTGKSEESSNFESSNS